MAPLGQAEAEGFLLTRNAAVTFDAFARSSNATSDPCVGVLCTNGGFCAPGTGFCQCPPLWFGPRCEQQ